MKALDSQSVLPWLAPVQGQLRAARTQQRLSGALLLVGESGAGAEWLARWTAALALCTAAQAQPCGACQSCRWIFEGRHPDCLTVSPVEESKEIRIEQIRDMAEEMSLTSHAGGLKVGILMPADRMNRFAANALLKTLEEPPGRALLILVAAMPSRLPATIRSRCQRLNLPRPPLDVAAAWLTQQAGAGGWAELLAIIGPAPLTALGMDAAHSAALRAETERALAIPTLAELDPVATAERWSKEDYDLRLRCIETWLTNRIVEWTGQAGAEGEMRHRAQLREPLPSLNIRTLFDVLDAVRETRSLAETPVNRSLMLERLLWMLRGSGASARRAGGRAITT